MEADRREVGHQAVGRLAGVAVQVARHEVVGVVSLALVVGQAIIDIITRTVIVAVVVVHIVAVHLREKCHRKK